MEILHGLGSFEEVSSYALACSPTHENLKAANGHHAPEVLEGDETLAVLLAVVDELLAPIVAGVEAEVAEHVLEALDLDEARVVDLEEGEGLALLVLHFHDPGHVVAAARLVLVQVLA